MIKVLLVEDDTNMSFILKSSLEEIIGDYKVSTASNGKEALETIKDDNFDILVTDVEMPVMDGVELARHVKKSCPAIPVLFITGKTSAQDVVDGYNAGADMYIKKPFLPQELDAHISALVRMKRGSSGHDNSRLPLGRYSLNTFSNVLEYPEGEIHLTVKEAKILELLVQSKGKIVPRKDILNKVWGHDDFYTSRSLDVFLSKLRRLFADDKDLQILVHKGIGIMLSEE